MPGLEQPWWYYASQVPGEIGKGWAAGQEAQQNFKKSAMEGLKNSIDFGSEEGVSHYTGLLGMY